MNNNYCYSEKISNPDPYENIIRLEKLDPYETLIKLHIISNSKEKK